MNTVADKIGMAYFHAGKTPNDLLSYYNGDKHDPNFRRALGMFEQLKRRNDSGDPVDTAVSTVRADNASKNYVIDKIADNLAELKRKADKVFGRIEEADSEKPGDCALKEPGEIP
jgi:hypothetical protein